MRHRQRLTYRNAGGVSEAYPHRIGGYIEIAMVAGREKTMRTMVQCGRCKGTGHIPNTSIGAPPGAMIACYGCGGDGSVNVNTPPTQCGRCHGTGQRGKR